ncbi:hypothetical protein ACRASX_15295 [Flavobacterium sp. TMP13]|uniref:hypothetical protein n=1 Tax=unclassified Flavobacterium TaxID=196869 RepID=UPI00076D382F|nr:hypothetical protein [Flavobacterium sp. TAB 87]KVV16272.1 hypothetical protein AP058_00207 [Flavobacterium sp. TAB 87]
MEIQPPIVVDYDTVYKKFKEGLLEKDSYYNTLFRECRNMKIQTIYFIKDEFNSTFALNQNSYFADYSNLFRKNLPFFEFHL